jgi:hypothetical protein
MSGAVSTPGILNVTLTTANTEYPVELPPGTRRFKLQPRGTDPVKLSYKLAESGSAYWTVKVAPNEPYTEDQLTTGMTAVGRKLYLQSAGTGVVVEIVYWT